MKKHVALAITTSLLLFSNSSFADNCEEAAYFYTAGNYQSAHTLLNPLVLKGEACAEYYMGVMYEEGAGVKKSEENRLKGISLIESAEKKGYPAAKKFMKSYH